MNSQITQNSSTISLLDEIFLTPSNQTITERFSLENQIAATCSGKCSSGKCRFVNHD
jgi:hypothetical protein